MVQGAPTLAHAPVYIARAKGFFVDEGLDVDLQQVQGDSAVVASVSSGEAQMAATNAQTQLTAFDKGLGFLTVAGSATSQTYSFAARKDFLDQRNVTAQSALPAKIAALKGAKVGVPTVAGSPAQLTKYVMKLNGFNPDTDVELVLVGFGAARVAALRQGLVDLFLGDMPDPETAEHEGAGVVFISLGQEIPAFKSFLSTVVLGKKDWIEKNPELAERACRAVGRACNMLVNDLPQAKDTLKSLNPQLVPKILDRAMDNAKGAFATGGKMNEPMWKAAADVFLFSGGISAIPSLAEGTLWTNRYLANVPSR